MQPLDLTGFDPRFGVTEYTWGEPTPMPYGPTVGQPWKDHRYHAECLSWHYHDYMGTHLYCQVWDYANQGDPDQHWQYYLLAHLPTRYRNAEGAIYKSEWAWSIAKSYESNWEERRWPTHTEVGADIDEWLISDHYELDIWDGDTWAKEES